MKRKENSTAVTIVSRRRALPAFLGCVGLLLGANPAAWAQTAVRWKVHDMNRPRPPAVSSAFKLPVLPPSDAIVLFDGSDLSKWRSADGGPSQWIVKDDYMESVRGAGYIFTRDSFGDVQLHIEWAAPVPAMGKGQGRGNSGLFLMGLYEIQVLDSYDNITYTDGQAAAVYGQYPPLVNASRPPGEWQSYDIFFRRPRFAPDGRVLKPARVTVLHNGILVQDNAEIWGGTSWLQYLPYRSHPDRLPLSLQDHGNPVRFRNIWLRELPEPLRPGRPAEETKPVITLTEPALDRYTGRYEVAPERYFTISREGSQLYAQIYELPPIEIVTHSAKEFSLRWTAARFDFDLDSQGTPKTFTFHIGGDEIHGSKVK